MKTSTELSRFTPDLTPRAISRDGMAVSAEIWLLLRQRNLPWSENGQRPTVSVKIYRDGSTIFQKGRDNEVSVIFRKTDGQAQSVAGNHANTTRGYS